MKKTILLTISFFVLSNLANAQFGQANQQLLSGSFNLSPNSSKSQPNFSSQQKNLFLGVGIGYGRFVKKNVLSFFSLGYNYTSNKNINNNQEVSNVGNGFNIGYRQIHFKEIAKKLFIGLSIGGSLNLQNTTQKNVLNPIKTNAYAVTVGIAPVLSYQISERLVINLQPNNSFADLSYSNSSTKDNTGTLSRNNSVQLNAGFFTAPLTNLSFGFNYLLKNKGK
ncbi:hypothetical protein [Sediminibacterium sp.]|uniref:hypothetical protein n=1 Tax=Sediminibacterium sp. TaxID=1917865 RepID=UPI0025F42C2A|nr:hypothetical protein [Sediminibacterium sp.]